jgi:hypothetical protein
MACKQLQFASPARLQVRNYENLHLQPVFPLSSYHKASVGSSPDRVVGKLNKINHVEVVLRGTL